MLYFHNTSEEIQKLASYAATVFSLFGLSSQNHGQGLCPWTPLEEQPPDTQHIPQYLLFLPKSKVSG